jgi:hypothetical protein
MSLDLLDSFERLCLAALVGEDHVDAALGKLQRGVCGPGRGYRQ